MDRGLLLPLGRPAVGDCAGSAVGDGGQRGGERSLRAGGFDFCRDTYKILDMQLQRPLAVIAPSVSADVLTILARAEAAFTPPEVHRLLGAFSEDGVRKALKALARQGIVITSQTGNTMSYALNRQHLAAPHIVALATLRDELIKRLAGEIGAWKLPCRYSALFGSAARNDMRADSDLDLFVVRDAEVDADDATWRDQIDSLEAAASAWTGNDVRTLEYDETEFFAASAADAGVVSDIRNEGIRLTGQRDLLSRVKLQR